MDACTSLCLHLSGVEALEACPFPLRYPTGPLDSIGPVDKVFRFYIYSSPALTLRGCVLVVLGHVPGVTMGADDDVQVVESAVGHVSPALVVLGQAIATQITVPAAYLLKSLTDQSQLSCWTLGCPLPLSDCSRGGRLTHLGSPLHFSCEAGG